MTTCPQTTLNYSKTTESRQNITARRHEVRDRLQTNGSFPETKT